MKKLQNLEDLRALGLLPPPLAGALRDAGWIVIGGQLWGERALDLCLLLPSGKQEAPITSRVRDTDQITLRLLLEEYGPRELQKCIDLLTADPEEGTSHEGR